MYSRQRKTWLRLCLVGMFSLFLFYSCQDDSVLTGPVMKSRKAPKGDGTYELSLAESFYKSHKGASTRSGGVPLSELPVCPYIPHKRGDPSWKYYAVSQNDTLLAVDVDLTDRITQDYIPLENVEAYRKTGRLDYLRSYTRYVYTLNRKTGEEQAFYMTFIPTAGFVEKHNRRIRGVTYLHRDEALSGYVLYHDLEGNFVNGWKYRGGKVIKEVLPFHLVYDNPEANPVLLLRHRCTYSVRLKVDALTRAMDDDEGWDIDGGELPEFVVTPDNGDDNDDGGGNDGGDSGWGNLIDTPGGTYTDEDDDNDSWDGDDNDSGGSGWFPPGETPKDDNNGGYRPPQPDDGKKPVTEANFKEKVLTSDFLNKVKQACQKINETLSDEAILSIVKIQDTESYGNASFKDDIISVEWGFFNHDWTINDAQSIIFHEFVHYEQSLNGFVPEYDANGKTIKEKYESEYAQSDYEAYKMLIERMIEEENIQPGTEEYETIQRDLQMDFARIGTPMDFYYNETEVRNDLDAMQKELEYFGDKITSRYRRRIEENIAVRKAQIERIEKSKQLKK